MEAEKGREGTFLIEDICNVYLTAMVRMMTALREAAASGVWAGIH